jgi:hypothetical protein
MTQTFTLLGSVAHLAVLERDETTLVGSMQSR